MPTPKKPDSSLVNNQKFRIAYKVRRWSSEEWIYCVKSTWELYPDENRRIEYIPISGDQKLNSNE